MQAWIVRGVGEPAEVLRLEEVPTPEPSMVREATVTAKSGEGAPVGSLCLLDH